MFAALSAQLGAAMPFRRPVEEIVGAANVGTTLLQQADDFRLPRILRKKILQQH
jgi:hypothetical protein